ncbi:DUF4124 domain-containing protein [Dyella silvatica]|uniref:DUF4124 domain-containing protein n=1 Tax=Dyella silvatica TaxID=2992128 RepID=UPI00224F4859|nr:DUF4124 domain-containing protein [Dyella silvatica]
MRRIIFVVAATALTLSLSVEALQTQGQSNGVRYRWRDGSGLPHYSDSLTSDAMKYGYDLVNDHGLVIQHVERQLNPEERAAAQKLADQQAAQKLAVQERARTEMQMLMAYPDEDSYKSSLKLELDNIDQQITTTRLNLHSQEKALADLLARAADAERAKQPVPKSLSDSIAKQRNVVAGQRNTLERQQNLRDAADQKATQQLQRYRELKEAQAHGQAQP